MITAREVRQMQQVDVSKQLEIIEEKIILCARYGGNVLSIYEKSKMPTKADEEIKKQLRIAGYHVCEHTTGQFMNETVWVRVSW